MKKKTALLLTTLLTCTFLLTGCGEDKELTQFKKDMDNFCTKISEIDTSINGIDADSDNAVEELLTHLDELKVTFNEFAKFDFPEEFDYLESIAQEASDYMDTAVSSYHDAYSNDSYNEYTAEYAQGNYSRAYKRIQIIISFLHGETPEDVNITTVEDSTAEN
ncbi:MAG: hypothetical protein KIG94_07025 [Acetatifactor sp.]|nr:hypothetical protein [Acetatifactor sp.]